MILNILTIIKTMLYIYLTEIKINRVLVLIITSLITISVLELLKKTKWKSKDGLRLLFYSTVSVILFADTVYYIQFNTLPSVTLLKQLGLLSAVGDSVKDLLSIKNLLLILDIPILIIGFIIRGNKKRREDDIFFKRTRPNYFLFSMGLLIVTLIFTGFTDRFESLKSQEIYIYHFTDIKDNLFKSDQATYAGNIDEDDLKELEDRTKLVPGKLTGLGKDKNLLVIQVEALQSFAVGLEYEGQEVTPEINKLIKDQSTVYYDRYYQLVGRGNTSDAEFVSNNSLHPSMDEPSYTRFADNTFYGLPKLLKDKGYKTVAMHGHDGEYWNRREAYKTQGFDDFLDEDFYKDYEKIGLGVSDEDFYIQSLDYLKEYKENNENPFYGFLVTLTSHTPFNMPDEYMKLEILPEHEDTMFGRYINSIHYADKQIGLLMDYLKETGLYDDTVVALYGDHFAVSAAKEDEAEVMTEYFGERYDFDTMMNIPLIVHLPNENVNQTISNVGSQLDFYPTMLNIMGYENEKGLMFGRDITNFKGYNYVNPQTYMGKGSFIDGENVFVISRDGIFENSRAYNIETREEVDIEGFKDIYEQAIEEINLSDYILNNGVLEDYILSGGSLNLDIKAGEASEEEIYRYEGNGMDEIKSNKDKLIYLDLKKKGEKIEIISKEKLEIKDVIDFAEKNNMKIIVGSNRDEVEVLKSIYKEFESDRIIGEIKNYESYLDITNGMYEEIILNPKKNKYTIKEIESFTSRHPNLGIVIDEGLKAEDIVNGSKIYKYMN